MNIEPIELNDEIEALLVGEKLPVLDLYSSNQTQLFGVEVDARIIGVVGIEIYGNAGLLRSLAVDNGSRKAGYGQKMVARAEAWAYERGAESLYLLTTTAAVSFHGSVTRLCPELSLRLL